MTARVPPVIDAHDLRLDPSREEPGIAPGRSLQ